MSQLQKLICAVCDEDNKFDYLKEIPCQDVLSADAYKAGDGQTYVKVTYRENGKEMQIDCFDTLTV